MIRVYGLKAKLNPIKAKLSNVINLYMINALSFPNRKRVHVLLPPEAENFFYPEGSSEDYTVIEITIMEGREISARKALVYLLFTRIETELGIQPADIEISIAQAPAHDWGTRGMTGDQLKLGK